MDLRLCLLLAFVASACSYGVDECYECNERSSNLNCRQDSDKETCSADQYCQTTIDKDGEDIVISKGCVDAQVCFDAEDDNGGYCEDGIVKKAGCSYCCEDELCNEEIPHYHEAWDTCSPWGDWSGCSNCRRSRKRTCGLKSKSGSGSGSGSKSRRRRDDDEAPIELVDAERLIFREKRGGSHSGHSHSGSGSGSTEEEVEIDNCCQNSCFSCDSLELNIFATFDQLDSVLSDSCSSVECDSDQALCQTIITYSPLGLPHISKGCSTSDGCKSYESGENCPNFVGSDAEAIYVGQTLAEEDVMCSYCCDNGVDEYGITCNSGLIPPAKYLSNGAVTSVASILATVVMVALARMFAI